MHNRHIWAWRLAACLLACCLTAAALASVYDAQPKLVIVIDQFRGDLLDRGHDLAVTLANLLGINSPNAAVGRVLTDSLRAPGTTEKPR